MDILFNVIHSGQVQCIESDSLLAVRSAGAPFAGRHNIRSKTFESLVQQHKTLNREIPDARLRLLQELYEAVPRATDPSKRHALLHLKRKISNFAVVPEDELNVLDPEQRLRASELCELLRAREALLHENRESVFQEFREQLETLSRDEEFRFAVNYSCPWLLDSYRRHGPGDNLEFSNEERGIYAYATRFFSKANPFHIFASIAFPPYLGLVVEREYEVVVNTSVILQLERHLLPQAKDNYRRFIYLRGFLARDNTYDFFVVDESSLRRITIPQNVAIDLVIQYFKTTQPPYTLGGCIEYLVSVLAQANSSDIEKYVFQLVKRGVLVEYLVANFNDFANDLLGIDPTCDALIMSLQQLHLARMDKPDLLQVEQTAGRILATGFKFDSTPYYVNAYSRESTSEYAEAANRLHPTLKAIKPLMLACNNFADWSYVISAFIRDYCASCPNRRVPYFVLLAEFCRNMPSILSRDEFSVNGLPQEKQAWQAWVRHVAECEGMLSDEQLLLLISKQPHVPEYPGNICFNGAFDANRGVFYPQNFFAGNGRYVSRYLPDQIGNRCSRITCEERALYVQIVPGYEENRFYVAPMLPTGCGFDARYRYQFVHWIDPADVIVESQDGNIVYYEGSSGRVLRFHFFGFLLGQTLRPEYQLLLTAHADFFYNPFNPVTVSTDTVQHIEPVYYKSVCLRREQWRFPKKFFEPAWKNDDILRCTIALLESLEEAGIDFTQSYFELFGPANAWAKPRYFEISNPLSVHTFRRAVRSSSPGTMVSLTRMEPPQDSFLRAGQCPHVTELMIEA